jgi:predicted AAA+ superfamily ATPase
MLYIRKIKTYDRTYFLLGPRGTGKSSFLLESYPDAFRVDLLDEAIFQELAANPHLFSQQIASIPNTTWIIIDEVQRLPSLLNEVHKAIESKRYRFVLCGSSARKLRRSGVNLLGGRASESFVFPLMPEEYGTDFQLERSLRIGDIPLVVNDPQPTEALKAYVRLYLKEEIQAEAIVRNFGGFTRFLQIAAIMNSQVLNVSSLARDAGVKRSTIDGYLSVLEDTLMGFRLPAYEAKIRVKERSHPKLYLFDCGVVRMLKGQHGPVDVDEKGFLLETWVANYLRAMRAYHDFFDDFYYWAATNSKSEVDFLVRSGSSLVAIEVKSTTQLRPEFFAGLNAIVDLKGLKRRILIYMGDKILKKDGIECLPLTEFLKQFESGQLF